VYRQRAQPVQGVHGEAGLRGVLTRGIRDARRVCRRRRGGLRVRRARVAVRQRVL
jgi:hypothetical protein